MAIELVDETKFIAEIEAKVLKKLQVLLHSSSESNLVKKTNLFAISAKDQERAIAWFKSRNQFEKSIIIGSSMLILLMGIGTVKTQWDKAYQDALNSQEIAINYFV